MIFLSHATADDAFVAELRERLEALRLPVWVDSRNLRGGSKLEPEIEAAIEQARHPIPFSSRRRCWCRAGTCASPGEVAPGRGVPDIGEGVLRLDLEVAELPAELLVGRPEGARLSGESLFGSDGLGSLGICLYIITVPAPARTTGVGPIRPGVRATPAGPHTSLPVGCDTPLGSCDASPRSRETAVSSDASTLAACVTTIPAHATPPAVRIIPLPARITALPAYIIPLSAYITTPARGITPLSGCIAAVARGMMYPETVVMSPTGGMSHPAAIVMPPRGE